MQGRIAIFQLVLGIALITGAFSGRFNIRGFDYLPQTTAYRVVFFVLGVIAFFAGLYSIGHLHR